MAISSRLVKAMFVLPVLIGLSGCLGYEGDLQHGYQIDARAVAQVRPGLSAEQVLVILGTPSTTSTVGGSAWYYFSQKTERPLAFMQPKIVEQRILAVYFTPQKRVQRVAEYGLQDGQVFDFLSRTTPTGGHERSFIQNTLQNLLKF